MVHAQGTNSEEKMKNLCGEISDQSKKSVWVPRGMGTPFLGLVI